MKKIKKPPLRTLSSRLRAHWPEIDQQMAEGIRQTDIVEALHEAGIDISLQVFRNYLSRRRRKSNAQAVGSNHAPRLPALPPGIGGATPPQKTIGQPTTSAAIQDNVKPLTRKQRRDAYAAQYIDHELGHPSLQQHKEHES